jgi:hypothetical protein
MTITRNSLRAAGAALPLLALAALVPASAQVVTGGTGSTTKLPFGTNGSTGTITNYAGEYQQIYSASAFSTPVAISAVSFASASDTSGLGLSIPETATYNFVIGISNTSATVAAPSTTFSNNLGTNYTTVFTGTVTANLLANNTFDLTIPFSTAFLYVPGLAGQSNLLLDVFINNATAAGPGTTPGQTDLFVNGTNGQSSRVYYRDGVSNLQADQGGLETKFTVTPAPEPSSVVGLLIGAGAILVARKRRSPRA